MSQMYSQDDLLPISALQHLVFCERQAALIHIEQSWRENVLTVEGRQLHERVHEEGTANLHGVHTVRGLRVRSLRLGLVGAVDMVEFTEMDTPSPRMTLTLQGALGKWQPKIIEYKRGKPKIDRSDEIQLCAQVLCLEEMLDVDIPKSAFFYGKPRRRHEVDLDQRLRLETENAAARLHQLVDSGSTPPAKYSRKCRNCSLMEVCMPGLSSKRPDVEEYLYRVLALEGKP